MPTKNGDTFENASSFSSVRLAGSYMGTLVAIYGVVAYYMYLQPRACVRLVSVCVQAGVVTFIESKR